MLKGGGKLVVAASGRFVGPGHFGRMDLGDGVEKFSCHYEADLDRSGRSVLDIRPLLWKDGWPVAGDNFKQGTYEIQSERSGYALELGVEVVRMIGRGGGRSAEAAVADAAERPWRPLALRLVLRPRTRWPSYRPGIPGGAADSGVSDSTKYCKTGRRETSTFASATSCSGRIRSGPSRRSPMSAAIPVRPISRSPSPARTRAGRHRRWRGGGGSRLYGPSPEQLWRIDQLTDGTYRIMPKAVPNSTEPWS